MDFSSLIIGTSNFALFVFVSVFLSTIRDIKYLKRFKMLLLSSFFAFIFSLGLYFEVKFLTEQRSYAFIFTFITFFSIEYSLFLLAKMIMDLYESPFTLKWSHIIVYGILSGIVFSLDIVFGNYVIRTFLGLGAIGYPFYYMLKGMYLGKCKFWRSPFTYQIILLTVFYTLKIYFLFFINPNTTLINPSNPDMAFTMFSVIVLLTFYLTYLVEYNHKVSEEISINSMQLEENLVKTKEISESDPLTGIANRIKLNLHLDAYFDLYKFNKTPFLVAMIDVNYFKSINDSFGHQIGDEVLMYISEKLQNLVRDKDIVGRWGGDEFLIIFPETLESNIDLLTKKIQDGFNDLFPLIHSSISLSIGIDSIQNHNSIKELINAADRFMYDHKQVLKSKK